MHPDPSIADLQSNTLQSVLSALADLAVHSTSGAAASITVLRHDKPTTFVSTGPLATVLDETQYAQGHGPCLDAALGGVVMAIENSREETRWPSFTPVAIEHGALSSLSVPIPVTDSLVAGLNVYATRPRAFTVEDRQAVLELVAFAGAVIANMHLYETSKALVEQMRAASESRALIDQARGVLMAAHKIGPEEAFDLLRSTSQHSNRKIRDIAAEIVANATKP